MDYNRKFGQPTVDGKDVNYAPTFFQNADGSTTFAPDEATYNAHGYYRMANNRAEEREGQIALRDGYKVEDGECVTVWQYVAKPVDRADYDRAMEAHLRAERDARGYTDREPTDYMGSKVPRFAQDALDWRDHRDDVMLYGLEVINEFERTGVAPTLAEFKAGLPVIKWTEE